MSQIINSLLRHWRAMYRYRLTGLIITWIIAVLGMVVTFEIPKKYEANARVFVNTDSILKPLMVGMTAQADAGQRIALLSRLVVNRPNVEELISKTYPTMVNASNEERERLIDTISSGLEISGSGGRDNIYVIRYRDTKQSRAKHMVELLVEKFINSSAGSVASDSQSAKEFLDQQVVAYESKLKIAEANLKEFKLRNITIGDNTNYIAQLAMVEEQLSAARFQLHEAQSSLDTFRRAMNLNIATGNAVTPSFLSNKARLDLGIRIEKARLELQTLLAKYTDDHPDVVAVRHTLSEMQEQQRRIPPIVQSESRPNLDVPPPADIFTPKSSEQLIVSLVQSEAAVASLKARVVDYTSRHRELKAMANRMPEFEAELAQLNRDYDVNKKNYESLITRRESASIAGDMQSVTGVGNFRLIDPPRVSPTAVSSSRTKMLIISMLLACFFGFASMFLVKEIRLRVYDLEQLRQLTHIPVLGMVSVVNSEQFARQAYWRSVRFYFLGFILVAIYSIIVYVELIYTKAVL